MKRIFLSITLFVFINANGQVSDSMEIEAMRASSEAQYDTDIIAKVLPDFTAKNMSGAIYTNDSIMNGKVTFVNMWFVSCAPCVAEIPYLNRLYDMMKSNSDFQFFGITWESEANAKKAIYDYNIHFPVLSLTPPRQASKLTFGRGFPTNIVLDREGKIRSILSGGSLSPGPGFELFWKLEIEKALKNNSSFKTSEPSNILTGNGDIFLIDSASKIKSLTDLINHFQSKPLFIDLWALWCMPCREEFKIRNDSLDSFISKHNIARVFISIDNPKAKQIWKRVIYEYQLNGYHLLAGDQLVQDLKEKIYKNQAMELPRYIIVKEGKIVELNAFHPSDGQKLLKQLTETLL